MPGPKAVRPFEVLVGQTIEGGRANGFLGGQTVGRSANSMTSHDCLTMT
jgi:hypothetical protein